MDEIYKCSIKFKQHLFKLNDYFRQVAVSKVLTDVTLVCEDPPSGKFMKLKAHKLILSGMSPYFAKYFATDDGNTSSILIQGIPYFFVNLLLEFMYSGEIQLRMNVLKQFLEYGNQLHVEGLEGVTYASVVGSCGSGKRKNSSEASENKENSRKRAPKSAVKSPALENKLKAKTIDLVDSSDSSNSDSGESVPISSSKTASDETSTKNMESQPEKPRESPVATDILYSVPDSSQNEDPSHSRTPTTEGTLVSSEPLINAPLSNERKSLTSCRGQVFTSRLSLPQRSEPPDVVDDAPPENAATGVSSEIKDVPLTIEFAKTEDTAPIRPEGIPQRSTKKKSKMSSVKNDTNFDKSSVGIEEQVETGSTLVKPKAPSTEDKADVSVIEEDVEIKKGSSHNVEETNQTPIAHKPTDCLETGEFPPTAQTKAQMKRPGRKRATVSYSDQGNVGVKSSLRAEGAMPAAAEISAPSEGETPQTTNKIQRVVKKRVGKKSKQSRRIMDGDSRPSTNQNLPAVSDGGTDTEKTTPNQESSPSNVSSSDNCQAPSVTSPAAVTDEVDPKNEAQGTPNDGLVDAADSYTSPKRARTVKKPARLLDNNFIKDDSSKFPKKRKSNPYFAFSAETKPVLREQFPEESLGQIMRRVSLMWNDLDPYTKSKYQNED